MPTDKLFRLETSTLAIDTVEGKRIAVTVPAEAVLKVVSESSDGSQLLDVLWEGRIVVMFGIDVRVGARRSRTKAPPLKAAKHT